MRIIADNCVKAGVVFEMKAHHWCRCWHKLIVECTQEEYNKAEERQHLSEAAIEKSCGWVGREGRRQSVINYVDVILRFLRFSLLNAEERSV